MFYLVLCIFAIISSIASIINYRIERNDSAFWGWLVAFIYILTDTIDQYSKVFGNS